MSKVQFEAPAPPVPRTVKDRFDFASSLRRRPGKWALLGCRPTSGAARQDAYQIRNAKNPQNAAFFPVGAFEAVARDLFGEHRIYVRFVGERS